MEARLPTVKRHVGPASAFCLSLGQEASRGNSKCGTDPWGITVQGPEIPARRHLRLKSVKELPRKWLGKEAQSWRNIQPVLMRGISKINYLLNGWQSVCVQSAVGFQRFPEHF